MLDAKDRLLLKRLQSNFPLVSCPFKEIANRFGVSEKEIIQRLVILKNRGFIRYIGPVFNLNKLRIQSTLIALSVFKKDLVKTVKIINAYPEVTHNYLRNDKFNLWFTISSISKKKISDLLNEIKQKTKLKHLLNLSTQRVFKIDTRFKL